MGTFGARKDLIISLLIHLYSMLSDVYDTCVCVCASSTDYQERASAFCTGICMFEERKSYSECFDLCNWY